MVSLLKIFTYPSCWKTINTDCNEKVIMVVPITKKMSFIHVAILFFIYIDFVSGTPSIFSQGKSKTKDEKTKEEIPVIHRRLEMPAKVNHYGKKQKEAFMALVTYPLGFMNTDTQQAPFIEKFLTEYQKYKNGT